MPNPATAKAIDYSLKRWAALTHFVEDGDVPIVLGGMSRSAQVRALARGVRLALFTEELPWLTGSDLAQVMGRGLCEWLGWREALQASPR